MKGKKRQGSTLPMVIVTIVLLVAMIGILASIVDTGQTQTQRMFSYLKAKYTATSGTQLAWGAYLEADPKKNPSQLYQEFKNRANSPTPSNIPVKSTHTFKDGGVAEIEMNGKLEKGLRGPENYYITIKSRSKLAGSNDYYEHVVIFNFQSRGIRSEEGHLRTVNK